MQYYHILFGSTYVQTNMNKVSVQSLPFKMAKSGMRVAG